ncbi:MAG: bifunctional adenosylcobinamide kinase/adenosylcobinamide-phosphate guanylyltransferase [Planctomycetes bacterium]|nr:bifunctional adenosylcobinamide kinase/adenosylcobinamide-phosphate guanylyltransferase [Planctomycetota bacterium]
MKNKLIYITGGARSGKSAMAVKIAEKSGGRTAFLATAEPLDSEMRERIRIHRRGRPAAWVTLELSDYRNVAGIISELADKKCGVVIIDCLTLWISNLLGRRAGKSGELTGREYALAVKEVVCEISANINAFREFPGTVIIVSNETGMGIVPANQLARIFRDICGKANQYAAEISDEAFLMVSGIPVVLKSR